jgi:hypothetical protein
MQILANSNTIYLIDSIDLVAIQKINSLPSIEPLQQVGKICVAMGMGKISLCSTSVTIRGVERIGCMFRCKGYDVVPFVTGIYPDKELSSEEFDLDAIYSNIGKKDDTTYH